MPLPAPVVGENVEAMLVTVPARRPDHRAWWFALGALVVAAGLGLALQAGAGLFRSTSTPAPFDAGANSFSAAAATLDDQLTVDANPATVDVATEPHLARLTSALVDMRVASRSMTPAHKSVADRAITAGDAVLSADVASIDAIRTRDFNQLAAVAQQQSRATVDFNTQVQAWNRLR